MTPTDLIAGYAGIVSTAALSLEVRRWVESGPRLALNVMSRGKLFGFGSEADDAEYVLLNVANLGDRPTTLSMMAFFDFKSIVHRWLRRPTNSGIVPRTELPGGGGQSTPHVLQPGTTWAGLAKYDDELRARARSGHLFVAIHSSHSKRPSVARVVWQARDDDAE